MTKEYVTISIPRELYENVQRAIRDTGFRSVTEFIIFVTRQSIITQGEEKVIDRLKALGYM